MPKRQKTKKPKITEEPNPNKTPKVSSPPPHFQGSVLSWRFNAVDKGGPFAWSAIPDSQTHQKIVERLANFETMSESNLAQAGCHAIELHKLCEEAQKRLTELKLDDLDDIYSFRIRGEPRVFGVVRQNYVRVLWYDPNHKVCPSVKKNT
ncbi:unnamed protein product [Ectocarpus sp. 12 AP-2014]